MSFENPRAQVPTLILGWKSNVGRRAENEPIVSSFESALLEAGYASLLELDDVYGASSQR